MNVYMFTKILLERKIYTSTTGAKSVHNWQDG